MNDWFYSRNWRKLKTRWRSDLIKFQLSEVNYDTNDDEWYFFNNDNDNDSY